MVDAAVQIAAWEHPIGTPVLVARAGSTPFETITLTMPFVCDNRAQVMVSGHRGAVPLEQLAVVGKAKKLRPQEVTVFLTNPTDEDPGQTMVALTRMVRPADKSGPLPLGEAMMLHEKATLRVGADLGATGTPCLVYVEIRPGAWRRVVVESFAARRARLEAQFAKTKFLAVTEG